MSSDSSSRDPLLELSHLIQVALTSAVEPILLGAGEAKEEQGGTEAEREWRHRILEDRTDIFSAGTEQANATEIAEYVKWVYDEFEAPKTARSFHLIEAILSIEDVGELFYETYGALENGYVLFVDTHEDEFVQLHHGRRPESFVFPPRHPDSFLRIIDALLDSQVKEDLEKTTVEFRAGRQEDAFGDPRRGDAWEQIREKTKKDAPTPDELVYYAREARKEERKEERRLACYAARELLDEYVVHRRQQLRSEQKELRGDRGVLDIPVAFHIQEGLQYRSAYERYNHLFMADEGELFFSVILQRLSDAYAHGDENGPPSRAAVEHLLGNGTAEGDAAEDADVWRLLGHPSQGRHGLGTLSEDGALTPMAERVFEWIDVVCDQAPDLTETIFKGSTPDELHPEAPWQPPYGFGLESKEQFEEFRTAVRDTLDADQPSEVLAGLIRFFRVLHQAKKDVGTPYNPAELNEILHVDPFVMQVFTAHRERELNAHESGRVESSTVPDRQRRLTFFALPIDPVRVHEGSDRDHNDGVFALWVGFRLEEDLDWLAESQESYNDELVNFRSTLGLLGHPSVREKIERDLRRTIQEATHAARRAGAAAIIARNLSHNIGSHVLAGIADGGEAGASDHKAKVGVTVRFVRYLQQRMDFVAQVATEPPGWASSVEWDNDVHGYFAVLVELRNHLLAFESRAQNAKLVSLEKGSPTDDVHVKLPQGYVGRHAIYAILENVVRNAVQHGNEERLCNLGDGAIADLRLENEWAVPDEVDWPDRFFRITVLDRLSDEKSVSEVAERLRDPLLSDGRLATGNWGLKEIRIAAAFLRMIPAEWIDEPPSYWAREQGNNRRRGEGDVPPLVEVTLVDDCLAYRCYLPKLPDITLLGSDPARWEIADDPSIEALTNEWFHEVAGAGQRLPPVQSDFLVVDGELPERFRAQIFEDIDRLPPRIIVLTGGDPALKPAWLKESSLASRVVFVDDLKGSTGTELRLSTWSAWMSQFENMPLELIEKEVEQEGEEDRPNGEEGKEDRPNADDTSNNVICLTHSGFALSDLFEDLDSFDGDPASSVVDWPRRRFAFHHGYSGGTADPEAQLIAQKDMNPLALLRLKESAAMTIGILDERVFKHYQEPTTNEKMNDGMMKLFWYWWIRRVDIGLSPDIAVNNAGYYANILRNRAKALTSGLRDTYDFLLIHERIIKQAVRSSNNDFKSHEELVHDWSKAAVRVQVVTGRGRAETAEKVGVGWIGLSSLRSALDKKSKLRLVDQLLSVRAGA